MNVRLVIWIALAVAIALWLLWIYRGETRSVRPSDYESDERVR